MQLVASNWFSFASQAALALVLLSVGMSDTKVRMRFIIEHGLGQRWSQSPGYNKWKPGDENLDWIQYQVGSKTNKSLKWDFTGCSERRTESKTIVRLMEVWIRIKPEEETKMLLQNTKDNFESNSQAIDLHLNNLIKTVKILMKMISKWWW